MLSGKVFNMRLMHHLVLRGSVCALAAGLVLSTWQSAACAEDLDQLLKIAAEGAQSKADADKSDKSDKAADSNSGKAKEENNGAKKDDDATAKPAAKPAAEPAAEKPKPKYPPYAEFLKDTQKMEGLLTLHRKDDTLYAEIGQRQLDRDFIVLITIARGIGQYPLLGGFSWGFGDDAVWQFRKAGENIQLVRRNLRFTAEHGSPTEKAVKIAYTDSVLFSLPIRTTSPSGAFVVELTPVFMSDLPQIGFALPGFSFSSNKSTWSNIDVLPKNVELDIAATYASSGMSNIDSVADTRGVTVNVHYSISELPQTSYRPRVADDRVGYFLTALKDYSKKDDEDDRFVRYINRWNLEKVEPSAEMSEPKERIIFWLEKTIPFQYRKPIREGILEWNKAFEKAGFYDAIEVRQQPDDAPWDPGDIRYNTFRWMTAGAKFAMGPSRVNPSTGQILDADIIFDSDFLQYWEQSYETFTPASVAMLTGGAIDLEEYKAESKRMPAYLQQMQGGRSACNMLGGISRQFALGASVLSSRKRTAADQEKLIMQGLKEVTMHEVGHTFGLAHNFHGSTLYSLKDMNDVEKTHKTGLGGSVMDYNAINIMPKDETQGDYFSTTIGPYDMWAIEYGYKPIKAASPEGEVTELKKIAARSGEPGLAYASDDDARNIDPDPHSSRFDMTNDLVEYAKSQAKLVAESMPHVVDDATKDGDGYQRARREFGVLLARHGQVMFDASRYIGGLYVSRSHKGDAKAAKPLEVVPTERQRSALELLEQQIFNDKPFNISPEMYNQLAASHWDHWGTEIVDRSDYPAHEIILLWQDRILSKLVSPLTLARLHDSELKTAPDTDTLTTAELLERLTKAVFSEVDSTKEGEFTNRKPAISSLRRNLQRTYLRRLSQLAMGQTSAPQDCQTIAYAELGGLKTRIDSLVNGQVKLDSYSKAHLQETSARIAKVMDARMFVSP
jgi:hypothetical protein